VPGLVIGILYDARGNQTNVLRQNGVATTSGYSPERGWLLTQLTAGTTGTLQNLTYTRDGRGRITDVASTASNPADVFGEAWHYDYDDLDRLTSADNIRDNSFDQTFQYDAVGNMTSNSAVGTYSYPMPGSRALMPLPASPAARWALSRTSTTPTAP